MDRVEESQDPKDEAAPEVEDEPTPAEASDAETDAKSAEAAEPVDELTERTAEVATLKDKLQRVEAEFVNETKRIRRKAEQDRKYAIEKVVVDLLPVIDALHGASEALGDDDASKPMREGLSLVEKQLQGVFTRYGIAPIEAMGQPFDPARHQAMMMVENPDFEPQTVCNVTRLGYELNGRVVRPAEVIVVKAPPAPATEETEPSDEAPGGGDESGS